MRSLMLSIVILVAALASSPARAADAPNAPKQTVVQFRSIQDPNVTPDAAVCARAPFVANVSLGASLYAFETRESDGTLDDDDGGRRLGEGTACVRITDPTFPAFSTVSYYSELTLARVGSKRHVRLTMSGRCTLTSNDIPVTGLVLASCALQIARGPGDFVGGVASSNSVFNPLRLPGFDTGSYWTLRLFSE
jgi:hypothetical protein